MAPVEQIELKDGYSISRVIKGGWHLAGGHGDIDRSQAVKDMASFVEAGIVTFDCADIYTGVEELIGDFRRAYPSLAKDIRIHTKHVPDYAIMASVDAAYTEGIIDRSLQRLGMECLDMVQFCWWDTNVPGYVESAQVLRDLQQKGKIAELSVTNYNADVLAELKEAGIPMLTNQVQYSVLDNRAETKTIDFCRDNNMMLLCYGSLAGGFLTDNWLGKPEPTQAFSNRSLTKYKLIIEDFGGWDLFQELLQVLKNVGGRHGANIAQVAVRWVLDRPVVGAAIVGATSTRHLDQNMKVFDFKLTAEDFAEIARITDRRSGPVGDCFDLERDKTGRHGRIMKYNLNDDEE